MMVDEANRLVENMRVCCGDVQLDDDVECAEFCANPCDMRNGELRFCRQWLLKDAADMIEFLVSKLDEVTTKGIKLEIELEQTKQERDEAVKDIEYLLSEDNCGCDFCQKMITGCDWDGSAETYCKPIWRGVQKESSNHAKH